MLNQTVLVGRIVSDPKINETINDKKVTTIPLAVQRSYKNEEENMQQILFLVFYGMVLLKML